MDSARGRKDTHDLEVSFHFGLVAALLFREDATAEPLFRKYNLSRVLHHGRPGSAPSLTSMYTVILTIQSQFAAQCKVSETNVYLFLVCLYMNRFRVLLCQLSCLFSNEKSKYLRRELSQLVSNHILRYPHINVLLSIVHLKDQAHEVGQDCCAPGLCLDGRCSFTGFCSYDGKTGMGSISASF